MHGDGDAQLGLVRVFENMVAAGGVVNKKSGSLQSAEDFSGFDDRKGLAHRWV